MSDPELNLTQIPRSVLGWVGLTWSVYGWYGIIIIAFKQCHEDHPYAKFLGVCTGLKVQLDKCFRAEKEVKRRANFEASKEFKEKLRASKAAKAANPNSESG
ncbi:hypothetical protein R1sor_004975 [Riccia sorocarpa]|uniref:COX assembly mitochondrial protein n=1 Tax=Riccia sorocarpa TaxID=122646 RepID=A0ABD3HPP5_9MARC